MENIEAAEIRGFVNCLTIFLSLERDTTYAEEAWRSYSLTLEKCKSAGCADYDIDIIKSKLLVKI